MQHKILKILFTMSLFILAIIFGCITIPVRKLTSSLNQEIKKYFIQVAYSVAKDLRGYLEGFITR